MDRTMTGMPDPLPQPDSLEPSPDAGGPPKGAAAGAQPDPAPEGGVAAPRRRRRPFALVALAGLMLFRAFLLVIVIVSAIAADPRDFARLPLPDVLPDRDEVWILVAVLGPWAALLLASAIGLLMYKRSGWLLAMVITGVSILFDIVAFLDGTGSDTWMLLNVVTVFYLNQRDVRELVGDAAPARTPETASP